MVSLEEPKLTSLSIKAPRNRSVNKEDVPYIANYRYNGKLEWFNNSRKYGFVYCPDLKRSLFIHRRDVQTENAKGVPEFQVGQIIEFEIANGSPNLQAKRITLVGGKRVPLKSTKRPQMNSSHSGQILS